MSLLSRSSFYSTITRTLAWFHKRSRKAVTAHEWLSRIEPGVAHCDLGNPLSLFRRMALLRIDADQLAENPLLAREMQARCAFCGSKEQCVEHLTHEEQTGEPEDWPKYCPSAAMLNALRAVQNCPRAAQYVKAWPHR